jgi:hypothetical protein
MESMKKLDDIPKKNIFEVPEGYFDKLPLQIQARVEGENVAVSRPIWGLALKYALPVLIAGLALAYFLRPQYSHPEELLANIANEHLIAYLDETDITANDLLEIVNFNEKDADSLNLHLHGTLLGDFDELEVKGEMENEL